ncbi:hypothetical protein HHI36_020942 [Cryptolaemus montrouzieri]|uniref:Palmitoyltransferase n=1 Tax=Cryptolaemus montrouzieri TaxID=559131 RepID=A0ABD2NC17_9CUCU
MHIRRSIMPKAWTDAAITSFLMCMMPIIFYFNMFVVYPHFHGLWSCLHILYLISGTFILWNLGTNLIMIILCDTSIERMLVPPNSSTNWNFCSKCKMYVPPRSWHCKICNICILKRDHHCKFSSCCIGHYNHRYFLAFVFYMFISSIYLSLYDLCFIYDVVGFDVWITFVKVAFPLSLFFFPVTLNDLYLFALFFTSYASSFSFALLCFHMKNLIENRTLLEKHPECLVYDRGRLNNVKDIFGERWYFVWISPFIESKLPQDGVHWILNNLGKIE